MMINRNINNVDELRAEISRLELLQNEQEAYLSDQVDLLKEKMQAPIHFFQRVTSWMPSASKGAEAFTSSNKSQADWLTNSLRVALPFLFNKILFRKAGFIKKTLLLLASQKAAGLINQKRITEIIDKVTSIINPVKKRKVKSDMRDYGIPPDSETY